MNFVWAFLVGGLICVVGQLLIDLTKLTPARILVLYVVTGALTGGFTAAAGGVTASLTAGFLAALLGKSRDQS